MFNSVIKLYHPSKALRSVIKMGLDVPGTKFKNGDRGFAVVTSSLELQIALCNFKTSFTWRLAEYSFFLISQLLLSLTFPDRSFFFIQACSFSESTVF